MSDRQDPHYWRALKTGDFLTLTDYQSLADGGRGGKDYRIGKLRSVRIPDKESGELLAEYRFYELGGDGLVELVVVEVGEEFELRVYYLPSGFMIGTRDQLIDAGHTWFFLPPPNPEDFISSDLEYAPYPDVPPIVENGETVQREYEPGGFGQSVYGYSSGGPEETAVILTEYATNDETALNPLILIREERWVLADGTVPPEGGLVTPMIGCVVQPESIESYPGK